MDWNSEIKELYEKYTDKELIYSPTNDDIKLIRSPEYAFYQGYKSGLPQRLDLIDAKREKEQGWFSQFLGGEYNTEITDWLCELTQNAFDRGATKCTVIIENDDRVLKFGHNGEGIEGPDARKGYRIGDVFALIDMGISLKAYDLYSEGRFGVGFKYWKRHFSEVVLNSDGFSFGWTKGYELLKMERRNMGNFNDWTLFQFSGNGEGNEEEEIVPLNLNIEDLHRLKDAIRMRPTNFELEITINNSGTRENYIWNHKITKEEVFEGQRILSCHDSDPGSDRILKSTLMLIPPNSDFFPEHLVEELRIVSVDRIKELNKRRKETGKILISGDPHEIVQEWFSKVPFILGFFHEDGDKGSLLSMFPLSKEGKTTSRVSFSAPFDIAPSRLEFQPISPRIPNGTLERNRILIQMMIHSFGQFLKAVQKTEILNDKLIRHLLNNPPGQFENEPLDKKIREFAQKEREKVPLEDYRKKLSPSDVFDSACWPTSSDLYRIGGGAKQLDPLLIEYRKSLLDGGEIDDIQWLTGLLEAETIMYGTDQNDFSMPVCNWITELLSQEKGVGYSGIDLIGEFSNAS